MFCGPWAAIETYGALLLGSERRGLRVDLGRAQEAAGHLGAAREQYAKAVAIDPQYAAAHLRLGYAEGLGGSTKVALVQFDEAIRLYRAANRIEGEVETLVRKASRQTNSGDYVGARNVSRACGQHHGRWPIPVHNNAREADPAARVTMAQGQVRGGWEITTEAVARATEAGLERRRAEGLIDLANSLMAVRGILRRAALERSIGLASAKTARRTEMRGRSSKRISASRQGSRGGAQTREAPLRFHSEAGTCSSKRQTKSIIPGEGIPRGVRRARQVAADVLRYAESVGNNVIGGLARESRRAVTKPAGCTERCGTAIESRRFTGIRSTSGVKFGPAEPRRVLISLGRGREAAGFGEAVPRSGWKSGRTRIEAGVRPVYGASRRDRGKFEMLPRGEGRHRQTNEKPDGTALYAMVLREHAAAHSDGAARRRPGSPNALAHKLAFPEARARSTGRADAAGAKGAGARARSD